MIYTCETFPEHDDYIPGPFNVAFIAGKISATFNVLINDDDILEENENFYLSIDQTSLPLSVSIDGNDEATVTIVNDDGELNSKWL